MFSLHTLFKLLLNINRYFRFVSESLREYFTKYGDITEVMVMKDPTTRRSRWVFYILPTILVIFHRSIVIFFCRDFVIPVSRLFSEQPEDDLYPSEMLALYMSIGNRDCAGAYFTGRKSDVRVLMTAIRSSREIRGLAVACQSLANYRWILHFQR